MRHGAWARRAIGCALAVTGLAACGGGGGGGWFVSPPPPPPATEQPGNTLPPEAAVKVDPTQFLPLTQLRQWQVDLDERGLRATGSDAHEAYIDELHRRLSAAGVKDLRFEAATLERWSVEHWRLEIADGPQAGTVPTTSYVPYSGSMPPEGLTAPMAYLPPGSAPDASLAGKIVLVEMPRLPLTYSFFLGQALRSHDPAKSLAAKDPFVRPWAAITPYIKLIDGLKAAGAAGLVTITEDANGTYIPYHRTVHGVPGVYVDRANGEKLKALAAQKTVLRLVLPARVETVQTRNLIGVIPGNSPELTVINSHSDGTNGVEDNGPNAIVDMAQYLARLPKSALPRSIMVLITSGHFAAGVGAEDFIARHAKDGLLERIASVTTVEHLGAQDWEPDAEGRLVDTGRLEPAAMFMPRVPALLDASEAMLRNADAAPGFVMPPTNPKGSGSGHDAVWPGEGQYFWGQARLPTINYITGPYYLLSWGLTTADKVDYGRLHRETVAFTQMLLDLSRVPFAELRAERADAK